MLTAGAFFSGLGDLPGGTFTSRAWGVSGDGQTVVGYSNVDDSSGPSEAFRWTQGAGMQGLGLLDGATFSSGRAASGDGSVIVGHTDGAPSESFRWIDDGTENGTMYAIPDLPGDAGSSNGVAKDVSDDGAVIVGRAKSTEGLEAYIWTQGANPEDPGVTLGLGDLPEGSFSSVAIAVSGDGSAVAGWGTNGDDRDQAFRWTADDGMVPIPYSNFGSRAFDISTDGSVVVGFDVLTEETVKWKGKTRVVTTTEAFRWTATTGIRHLGVLSDGAEHYSGAQAVSENGSVIAGWSSTSEGGELFIWNDLDGMRSLYDVLSEHGLQDDVAGWDLWSIYDMTPDGLTFVGDGRNPDGNLEGFIISIAPPSPGISVTPSSGLQTSEDGDTDVINVVLDTAPNAPVTIDVSSNNPAEGEIMGAAGGILTLAFDNTNWHDPQTITVVGTEDYGQQDGDQPYSIQLDPSSVGDLDYDSLSTVLVSATNLDNDGPRTFTSTDTPLDLSEGHPKRGPGLTKSQLNVDHPGTIQGLEVALSINHGRPSDLRSVLTHIESGTSEGLFEHPSAIPSTVTTNSFGGQAIGGTWRLEIFDDQKNGTGVLESWSLTVTFDGQGGTQGEMLPRHLFSSAEELAVISTSVSIMTVQLGFESTDDLLTPRSSSPEQDQVRRSLSALHADVVDDVLLWVEAWLEDDPFESELHQSSIRQPHDLVISTSLASSS